MPRQIEYLLPRLHIPQLGGVVHGARGDQQTVGVEREAHDLHLVALQCVVTLSCCGVPDLCCAVK